MHRRILFAAADDEALDAVVPVVAAHARRWGAGVHVLHVHRVAPGAPGAAGRPLVTSVVRRLQGRGVAADGEVCLVGSGDPVGPVIARTATRTRADLVVTGTRGRTELGALLGGSVSHDVADGLDLPLLLVRPWSATPAEPRTVLVGVDGSPGADEAVVEAAEVADVFHASVRVVHVRRAIAGPEPCGVVGQALAEMERRGVDATGEVVPGASIAAGLIAAAEEHAADLVVLGSRRPSHLDALLRGGVAREVVRRLPCPVLLARRLRAGVGSTGGV